MAWLGNWSKRIKLTVDHERIDEDLTDFPVLVTLASGVGRNNADATGVFDELYTVSGTKKIAITTDDGITKCYVEIEHWDFLNEQAYLWTKIPTIVSGTDTDFYLYYDKDQLDNDVYIGDTGSTAGQNVWDSGFVGVWHMSQDPTNIIPQIKDSTSYNKGGTVGGSMISEDLVDGKIGKGLNFDGSDDYLRCGTGSNFDISDIITLEAGFKLDSATDWPRFMSKQYSTTEENTLDSCYQLGVYDTNRLRFSIGGVFDRYLDSILLNDGNFHYGAGVYDGSDAIMYLDSQQIWESTSYTSAIRVQSNTQFTIGASYADNSDWFMDGIIDEIRISHSKRSAAWINATYYSNWDNLITFSESQRLVFTCSGTVQVNNVFTDGISVRLYRRNNGELVGGTTTISGGLFEINSYYDEDHYVVALYTISGTNAIIYDYISP